MLSSTIDGAKGLHAHVCDGLDSEPSPDLFHPMRDAGRAVVVPVARKAKKAREEAEKAQQGLEQERDGRKRRRLEREAAEAKAKASETTRCEEEARAALRSVSENYHPVDLETGVVKDPQVSG